MTTTTAKRTTTLLRVNAGSYPTVDRVYAYDPEMGKALVLLVYPGNDRQLSEVTVGELEALDPDRKFVPVEDVLKTRAVSILRR